MLALDDGFEFTMSDFDLNTTTTFNSIYSPASSVDHSLDDLFVNSQYPQTSPPTTAIYSSPIVNIEKSLEIPGDVEIEIVNDMLFSNNVTLQTSEISIISETKTQNIKKNVNVKGFTYSNPFIMHTKQEEITLEKFSDILTNISPPINNNKISHSLQIPTAESKTISQKRTNRNLSMQIPPSNINNNLTTSSQAPSPPIRESSFYSDNKKLLDSLRKTTTQSQDASSSTSNLKQNQCSQDLKSAPPKMFSKHSFSMFPVGPNSVVSRSSVYSVKSAFGDKQVAGKKGLINRFTRNFMKEQAYSNCNSNNSGGGVDDDGEVVRRIEKMEAFEEMIRNVDETKKVSFGMELV